MPRRHAGPSIWLAILLALFAGATALGAEDPDAPIVMEGEGPSDQDIEERIEGIFAEILPLDGVEVVVESGVVTLSGAVDTAESLERAGALAGRVFGVVAVENQIERDFSFATRLLPAPGQFERYLLGIMRATPFVLFALTVFILIVAAGWLLASWTALWRRITPNIFIADLASSTVQTVFVIVAVITALRLLDATALLGAFLGAAGVIGLAIGFAVRDTLENYVSSIMLSLRQPFRPNEHVVIGEYEGQVIRLTSRATILMTLDGNHLRIPNSAVFKAVILNYSRSPQRHFDFRLGIGAKDDPIAAVEKGLEEFRSLPFILNDPPPLAFIDKVGDSNIILFFAAWIDQRQSDFAKSRSVSIAHVKTALEAAGFALPEPSYRLRIDGAAPAAAAAPELAKPSPPVPAPSVAETIDEVAPETQIAEKVEEERQAGAGSEDLLDYDAPTE